MEKGALKRSLDPMQDELRQRKQRWNAATSELIGRIIAFKKALNGRGDAKFGLPPSNIKNPLPPEIIAFLSELSSNYQALAHEAEAIAQDQEAYSQHRRKPAKTATAATKPHTGRVSLGKTTFDTLLALTPDQKERGLMYVEGPTVMSFVFDYPIMNKFWMKNTPQPLDLIFGYKGEIINIAHGEPYSLRLVGSDELSDIVVEVPFGTCEKMGIKIGDPLKLTY